MIYFMQPVGGGPIKIGYSENVPRRRKQLEYRYKRGLVVLATRRGMWPAEAKIHAMFSHLRIGNSEQFRPGRELMAFIGKESLTPDDPDAVEPMGKIHYGNPGPKPSPHGRRTEKITVACSTEWKEWAKEFAEAERIPVFDLIDKLLFERAKAKGFEPPPER